MPQRPADVGVSWDPRFTGEHWKPGSVGAGWYQGGSELGITGACQEPGAIATAWDLWKP